MMKNKKGKKRNEKIKERKSLSIINYGDYVIIKNRSTIAAYISGCFALLLCIAGGIVMKEAWQLPMFVVAYILVIIGVVYTFISMLFNKIILDSPNLQMNVYNPFKKQYKFDDVNYVDVKSSKPKDGVVLHKVTVYIGEGKKSVEISTMSSKQADELASLLRGMLDNAAMIYPEGNEEPFDLEDEKKKSVSIPFGLKKNKKDDSKEEKSSETTEQTKKAENAPEENERDSNTEDSAEKNVESSADAVLQEKCDEPKTEEVEQKSDSNDANEEK